MKCNSCSFCWADPDDQWPRCHYEGDFPAPCEIEEEDEQ